MDPSYPPFLSNPDPYPNPHPKPNPHPNLGDSLELPALDLAGLDRAGLVSACKNLGLFRLMNHGIPPGLSARLSELAQELMSQEFEAKKSKFTSPITYFWGTPAVTLKVKEVNWFEGFHVSLGQIGAEVCGPGSYGPTEFRHLISQYGMHMSRIARALFNVLAVELGLDENQLCSYLAESDGTFRVYRYPLCPAALEYLGMEAHTDSSVLSIVNQDTVGGLQVLQNNGWFNVEPVAGTLIVNLGDLMQAISSDKYKSVQHRVLASQDTERLSLCYFAFPVDESVIVSSTYRPFTYKEFRNQVQEDIKAFGSKVGLKRFAKVSSS